MRKIIHFQNACTGSLASLGDEDPSYGSTNIKMYNKLRCNLGASFKFFKVFCLFSYFPVPEPSKEAGDVFKCIGDVFCIEFAYGNV